MDGVCKLIEDYTDRLIAFQGCFNFRDIGGYVGKDGKSIKWGMYYRAGRQDRLTEMDKPKLAELNVSTQIDLRKPEEIADQGVGPLGSTGAQYEHIPVIPEGGSDQLSQLVGDTGISGERYLAYLEFGPNPWLRIFDLLAKRNSYPVVLHCTAGKDRTGVSTAFLLSVLGVDRATIEEDYLLTNRDVARQVEFLDRTVGLPARMTRADMVKAAGVPESAMKVFLNGLEKKYGGAVEYLKSIGIKTNQLNAISNILLE